MRQKLIIERFRVLIHERGQNAALRGIGIPYFNWESGVNGDSLI